MPQSPKNLSRRPPALTVEDPRGDVLADVLGAARLRNVLYKRVDCRAPWGIRVPRREHATFYLIARGAARLDVDGEGPVALSTGDVVFLPNGTPHVLRDSPATVPVDVCSEARPTDGRPRRLGGDGAPSSIVAEPWTVESLAAKVGLSRSAFAARFAGLVGEPPLQYLTRWRMARAAELLRDTSLGMGEIAARVGYDSVPAFNKAYKRWQGVGPGAFRRGAHADRAVGTDR